MIISSLTVAHFRNLRQLTLPCSSGLNLILGENASGKTSLLEAIYFLGRARSFRSRHWRELIQHDEKKLQVMATMIRSDTDRRQIPIGIERSTHQLIARVNRRPIHSLAELAAWLPVLLLNPDSHRLLEDGPQQRRRFMDWGLFHRDACFLSTWKRYRDALRHRNAALRQSIDERGMNVWEQELATAAGNIDQLRREFCLALQEALQPLLQQLLAPQVLTLDYQRGWAQECDLLELLRSERNRDRLNGHTRAGPHRADFSIRLDERPFTEQLSRGQQKLLVTALILAQAALYRQHRDEPCVLLLDDLPAELDHTNRDKLMACLAQQRIQLFVTAIEPALLPVERWSEDSRKVFKLSHGELHEMV
jgi:DNA replication and repair protein RecF